jgi:hypothetical protein
MGLHTLRLQFQLIQPFVIPSHPPRRATRPPAVAPSVASAPHRRPPRQTASNPCPTLKLHPTRPRHARHQQARVGSPATPTVASHGPATNACNFINETSLPACSIPASPVPPSPHLPFPEVPPSPRLPFSASFGPRHSPFGISQVRTMLGYARRPELFPEKSKNLAATPRFGRTGTCVMQGQTPVSAHRIPHGQCPVPCPPPPRDRSASARTEREMRGASPSAGAGLLAPPRKTPQNVQPISSVPDARS